MSKNQFIYQMITDKIVSKLKEGVVSWRQPWVNGFPVNWVTQKPYRGINLFLLDPGEYATLKQVKAAGGRVKSSEIKNANIVVFWKMLKYTDEDAEGGAEAERDRLVPYLKYYRVYNIVTQCEGLEAKQERIAYDHDPIQAAEELMKLYQDAPPVYHVPGRAYYSPAKDMISMPPLHDFKSAQAYYATKFHELAHSTGHHQRLNRDLQDITAFGDECYSKEELVAEIASAMLCGIVGIDNSTLDQSAAYIAAWIKRLEDDPRLIVNAAAQAQRAADYMQGISYTD